jgi:hydroxyacylglutathione hydrolase
MNDVRIVRVPILPLQIVNAYIVIGPGGCILVDSGLPGSENKIIRALAAHELSLQDIQLIVVTHAHVDHAGAAAGLRELSGAPIVAHRGDLAHFRRELPMTFCPTGLSGRLFYRTKLILEPYVAFTPDILLEDGQAFPLAPYGVPGRIEPTIGHTRGSISVLLSNGDALVGDLLASGILIGGIALNGHARRPPFEDDPQAVAVQLRRLLAEGSKNFYVGHGGRLEAEEVKRHADRLFRQPSSDERLFLPRNS